MKITGGTFGPSGTAKLSFSGLLIIKSAQKARYQATAIKSVNSRISTHRQFSALSFLFGALIITPIAFLLAGIVGAAAAFVLSIVFSFYSTQSNDADIELEDGGLLSVTGTKAEIRRLYRYSNR